MVLLDIIGLVILLLLSGFFSSTELAYVVSNKIKLEIRSRKNKIAEKCAMYFVKEPQMFFSTILISNNIVNIAFASLITVFLTEIYHLGDYAILFVSTTLLLIFGELVPKYIAREYADGLILSNAVPLRIISFILYPVAKLTASLSNVLVRTDIVQEQETRVIEKEDLQTLIVESSAVGQVTESDSEIISNIFELGEQKIYEAMTPRIDIFGVEINSTIDEVITTFITSGFSKLPVYEENLDEIKGVIFAKDIFQRPSSIKDVMRKIIFVPETKRSMEMLNEFLDKRISIAIVIDEFGGTAGLVTVEDIIEEMVGEIEDEYDDESIVCKKVNDTTYVLSGKVEIDFVNDEFTLGIPEGDYETVAGMIISSTGKIPKKGEAFDIGRFKINILNSDETKINLIKLFVKPE